MPNSMCKDRPRIVWDARDRASRRFSIELLTSQIQDSERKAVIDQNISLWLTTCPKLKWERLPEELRKILAVRL